jgi:hypothetical protein
MVAPEVPTGCAVGQAVLDHQTHGQVDDPIGIVTAGWGQIGMIYGEGPLATCATMFGVNDEQVEARFKAG